MDRERILAAKVMVLEDLRYAEQQVQELETTLWQLDNMLAGKEDDNGVAEAAAEDFAQALMDSADPFDKGPEPDPLPDQEKERS